MLKFFGIIMLLSIINQPAFSQHKPISRKQFFLSDSVINVQLITNIRKLRNDKSKTVWLPARIVMNFADTLVIDEKINIEPRGFYRKENCDIAALMLDFKTPASPMLSKLKKLKLVGGCRDNDASGSLLLREYLVYKMYNFLSPMSFRVRLLHVTYIDSMNHMKPYTQYAFLIEDIKDVAERNNCKEIKNKVYATESCSRSQTTFVNIFEYMVGNTDFSVSNYHNLKLMVPLNDTTTRPYLVPYDFDYSGVVNAPYATPDENLDIKNVRQRYYRGRERTLPELDSIVEVFKKNQDATLKYINTFYLLKPAELKDITRFLQPFYEVIKSESSIKYAFISNAIKG